MAAAEGQASMQSEPETWHGVVQRTLKRGVGVRKEVKTG
jgi:hypothetical protein